jgi:hypothetical protein
MLDRGDIKNLDRRLSLRLPATLDLDGKARGCVFRSHLNGSTGSTFEMAEHFSAIQGGR